MPGPTNTQRTTEVVQVRIIFCALRFILEIINIQDNYIKSIAGRILLDLVKLEQLV